jgi:hypothetical protein
VKEEIRYSFDEFFQEGTKFQNTIEDFVYYNYSKYNRLFKRVKSLDPEQDVQTLIDNSRFTDKLNFLILKTFNYMENLNRLGYHLEDILTDGNNLRIFLLDKKREADRKNYPLLEIDLNLDSSYSYFNVYEVRNFLDGNHTFMSKTDEGGNLVYRIMWCEKKLN